MADSNNVDSAVLNRLMSDATLMALLPDGVFWDVAKHGATRFVIVSQVIHEDEPSMLADAYERFTYLVKAVELTKTGANIIAASARINALLHRTTFAVTGYTLMSSHRIERIRSTEPDAENADLRWQHRGGRYEVWCAAV